MQNTYLSMFDKMFFDVEKNEDVKGIVEQSSYLLNEFITRFGELENEISAGTSKQDGFVDMVIMLFIRKIMEQLDAINILYASISFEQAQIILRSLIENIAGLEFILKENTEERAAAYYLELHFQEIEKGKTYFNKETVEGKMIYDRIGETEFVEVCKKMKKKEKAFKHLISTNPVFIKVDEDRQKKLAKKDKRLKNKKAHIQWYEVNSNVSSIYGLLKETGYEKYYDGIYGGLSLETHGLNATMGLSADPSGFSLKLIRNPEGGGNTFNLTCVFAMTALHKIYQYLKDGESEKREFKKFFTDFVVKRDIATNNLDKIKCKVTFNEDIMEPEEVDTELDSE